MKIRNNWRTGAVAVATLIGVSACGMLHDRDEGRGERRAQSTTQNVTLSGANEVPPVSTSASGSGWVMVNADRSVSAKITVTGMSATAAHIHQGAPGMNGGVIVPFAKQDDNTFVAPPGAKLTEEQYEAYKAGKTYVNVHSAKNPPGEIRAQLSGR